VYHRIEGKQILFVETPCHEEYERFRRQRYEAASGTLYRVTNSLVVLIYFNTFYKKSADTSSVYSAIMRFLQEAREEADSAPCILVGTKQDLRESEVEKFTFLPHSFGIHAARETGCLAYVEVSALTGHGIEALKQAVVRAPHYQAQSNKKKKCIQM
jgi:GTPase SAR1 family protein